MRMNQWNGKRLNLMADMAGCPNRCRHCWLGAQKNGCMHADDLRGMVEDIRAWRGADGQGVEALGVFTWWREPDFCDEYRALWALEQELSTPGCARRYELLSTWRLARDATYAPWAAAIGTKVCQITFFGMEENTDYFMRRRGAFHDQLLATERCLQAGILPRWQLFPTKRSLGELDAFARLMDEMRLRERCAELGGEFIYFLNSMSPEGNGYGLEDIRLTAGDLPRMPQVFVEHSRDGFALLGRPEHELLPALLEDDAPPNLWVEPPSIAINAEFDVYPNLAGPAPWWRLGNWKTDGARKILDTLQRGDTLGMRANITLPLRELARRYGDTAGDRLYIF